jgi:hypothetical protein
MIEKEFEPLKIDPAYKIQYDNGRITIKSPCGKILKPDLNNHGYFIYTIRGKTTGEHVLVATQYILNDDPTFKTQVNHINGIRSDNRVENLEWVDFKTNCQYRAKAEYITPEEFDELDFDRIIKILTYNNYGFENLFYDLDRQLFYEELRNNQIKLHRWKLNNNYQAAAFTTADGHQTRICRKKLEANLLSAGYDL